MSWTAGGLAETLAVEMGKEWGDPDNEAQILAFINDAYKIVVSYADWFWLRRQEDLALATSASTITLSTAAVQPVGVTITSPTFKELLLIDATDMVGIDDTTTGQPRYVWVKSFADDAITLQVYPVADGNYTIRVIEIVKPANLSDETTIPVPEDFIPLIKDYTRQLMLRSDGDYYGAKMVREEFYTRIEIMKRKIGVMKGKRTGFCVNDVNLPQDKRLPRLPGNYPEY